MRPISFNGVRTMDEVGMALQAIANASQEDAIIIADEYTVSNFTPTRTLNAGTATATNVANFLATFIDDMHRRGSSGA